MSNTLGDEMYSLIIGGLEEAVQYVDDIEDKMSDEISNLQDEVADLHEEIYQLNKTIEELEDKQ